MIRRATVLLAAGLAAGPLYAQRGEGKLRVAVADFEYDEVRESAREIFGGEADVGVGIADLVAEELKKKDRFEVVGRAALPPGSRLDYSAACNLLGELGVDVVITGGVAAFGKVEGEVAGVNVRVGRIGIGRIGREHTVGVVALAAQFVGGPACTPLAYAESRATAEGSGTSLTGGVDLKVISAGGRINMSGEQYRKTTIGKATVEAVGELVAELEGRYGEVRRALEAAAQEPVAPAAPLVGAGALGGVWGLYQFKGTEYFKYDAEVEEEGERKTGWYTLEAQPAGEGRFRLTVAGLLGEDSFRTTTTTSPGQGIPFMQVAAMGPGAIVLFSPMYGMLLGHEWELGSEWSFTSEGETVSFKVEAECSHAGVRGLRGVWRENQEVRVDMCVSPEVALPLAVLLRDEGGEVYRMTLVEYRP
ncbi:MAG: hypothetical protein KatS3mg081_2333 [Gemmatimonadales bacterium]|nr:MAG: hypothetical protein KatS3mg081_2333 [Gemmatimonadales bacterium]